MDWKKLIESVGGLLSQVEPVIGTLSKTIAPELSPAISLFSKIMHGVLENEPVAMDLYNRLANGLGTPPTPDELKSFAANYEASYQKLHADIADKLALS